MPPTSAERMPPLRLVWVAVLAAAGTVAPDAGGASVLHAHEGAGSGWGADAPVCASDPYAGVSDS